MAVAFDAVSSGQAAAASSQTISHTCTGANLVLYVITGGWDGTGRSITVTYAGVSMTQIADSDLSLGNDRTWLFRLVAPATGSNNVVVTITGGNMHIRTGNLSFTGAHQSVFDTPQTTVPNNTTTASDTFTSAVGDMVVYGASVGNDDPHTATDALTERYDLNGSGQGEGAAGGTAAGAASVVVTINWDVTGSAATAGVNINAAAADVVFVTRPQRPMPLI